jgi:hypothetical protein
MKNKSNHMALCLVIACHVTVLVHVGFFCFHFVLYNHVVSCCGGITYCGVSYCFCPIASHRINCLRLRLFWRIHGTCSEGKSAGHKSTHEKTSEVVLVFTKEKTTVAAA